jgi:hypothetical protein
MGFSAIPTALEQPDLIAPAPVQHPLLNGICFRHDPFKHRALGCNLLVGHDVSIGIEHRELKGSSGRAQLTFSLSHLVAINGKTIVAGASGDNFNSGAAYVFVRPGGGWLDMTETAKLTASDATGDDLFGAFVSIHGDTVVVGAQRNSPSLICSGRRICVRETRGGLGKHDADG